ncbi:YcxB family protein [Aneurinibacillus uraniidurans]|uniref:YcxB family protein n=1 Tax=Aneurinibacillus uraniidurans TaxID=2966586 RepID=UPI002348F095|nr:YcxB family protein [Aneurinibacillus sp. B1]WCN39633.1 YcxB family protein [Aneurinibacillus sp. B1]
MQMQETEDGQKSLIVWIELEEKDFLEGGLNVLFRSPRIQFMSFISIVLLLSPFYLSEVNPAAMFFPLFVFVILPLITIVSTKLDYKNKRELSEPKRVTFSSTEIKIQISSALDRYTWNNIRQVVETKNLILLYIADSYAVLISKRCLTEDELNEIRSLQQKYGPKKRIRLPVIPVALLIVLITILFKFI